MGHVFTLFVLLLIQVGYDIAATHVKIKVQRYAQPLQTLLVNCTSSKVPVGQYAEFIINDKLYTKLSRYGTKCHNTINCIQDDCLCSTNGLWYSLKYKLPQGSTNIHFKCVMKFADVGQQFDETVTTILDIVGPIITINQKMPLVAGTEAHLDCEFNAQNSFFNMTWNCMKVLKSKEVYSNSTTQLLRITFLSSFIHDGVPCVCEAVTLQEMKLSANIILQVENSPILILNQNILGKNKTSVNLICVIDGELFKYDFLYWMHMFNGTFIREINGTLQDSNTSVIVVDPNLYEDTGDYTCSAWNDHNGKIYTKNKTTTVAYLGLPVNVKSDISQNEVTVLSLEFLPVEENFSVKWYQNDELLHNSTEIIYALTTSRLKVNVHGQEIWQDGISASLTMLSARPGQYSVSIANTFGEIKQQYTIKPDNVYSFKLHMISFGLVGVILLIIITAMTGIASERRSGYLSTEERSISIYHAAPSMNNERHIYNMTSNQYDECSIDENAIYFDVIGVGSSDGSNNSEHESPYDEIQ